YCEHAQECRRLDQSIASAENKVKLLSMAETWENLAVPQHSECVCELFAPDANVLNRSFHGTKPCWRCYDICLSPIRPKSAPPFPDIVAIINKALKAAGLIKE